MEYLTEIPTGTETEEYWLGYLAGILDGEGTLAFHKLTRKVIREKVYKRGFDWHPVVQVGNDNMEALEVLQNICKGGTIHPSRVKGGLSKANDEGEHYILSIPPNIQRYILPKLALVIKERNRVLLIEALSKIGRWNKTPEVEERLFEIYEEFKELNSSKGRSVK